MSVKYPDQEKALGLTPADVPLEALPTIKLTQEEIHRALELAEERNGSYKAIDGGLVFGDQDSLTNHQIGVLGEAAVAKLYGIELDTTTYQWGDGGKDHSLYDFDLDTKTTATQKIRRPELLVRADKTLKADEYIRAHVVDWTSSSARVRLIGRASREKVKSQTPRCHPGTTKNYVVSPAEMDFLPLLQPLG